MPMLARVTMIEPGTGRRCAVMVRDQKAFKERGFKLVKGSKIAAVPSEPDASAEEFASPDADSEGLAVESRAFEQPDRKPAKRRRRSR